jgi:hypothetical protein
LADPGDKVVLDCSLADDYRPTPGGIRVQDDMAHNGYFDRPGKNDQHNKYGDLRAPALSDVVRGVRLLKMGSETRPAWQSDREQCQIRCEPFTA